MLRTICFQYSIVQILFFSETANWLLCPMFFLDDMYHVFERP